MRRLSLKGARGYTLLLPSSISQPETWKKDASFTTRPLAHGPGNVQKSREPQSTHWPQTEIPKWLLGVSGWTLAAYAPSDPSG